MHLRLSNTGKASVQVDGVRIPYRLGVYDSIGRVVFWCRLMGTFLLVCSSLSNV